MKTTATTTAKAVIAMSNVTNAVNRISTTMTKKTTAIPFSKTILTTPKVIPAKTTQLIPTTKLVDKTTSKMPQNMTTKLVINRPLMDKTNTTDGTLVRKPMFIIPILALIIAISGTLVVLLMVWRYMNQNKWKRCNSIIEYRTKKYAKQCDSGNAILLDDSMSITLIDNGGGGVGGGDGGYFGIDDDVDCDNKPDEHHSNQSGKFIGKSKSNVRSYSKTDKMPIASTDGETQPKPRKVHKLSTKSLKRIDQYSEKRCLTADEEQFDFSLQSEHI